MEKPLRNLLIAAGVCALLGIGAWLVLTAPGPAQKSDAQGGLAAPARAPGDVRRVEVQNASGKYTVKQDETGPAVEGLSPELGNPDYLAMLLDECSSVQYESLVAEHPDDYGIYGLAQPEAAVDITYSNGDALTLLLGAQEPISGGRYFKTEGSDAVMLMKAGRTVRFTMPVEKYIDSVIIPPEADVAPLNEIGNIRFSGVNFPEPVLLHSALQANEELRLQGLSFGVYTHLIVSPGRYEGNATALSLLADQLLGLLSEGVVDYDCTPKELAGYGFDQPYLQIDFNYKNGKDAPIVPYTLRVSRRDGDYIATVNDKGVVYKILDQRFLHLTYDDLILRWFVSPLISDVQALEVTTNAGMTRYELSGKDARDIAVTENGVPLDAALFRRYYNLVTSAASSGKRLSQPLVPSGEPLLTLRYCYKNEDKADDFLEFFPDSPRMLSVRVNGVCEFTMRDTYAAAVGEATAALLEGTSFSSDWQ